MTDLIQELRASSDAETPLDNRLERVRISAEAIWDLPRLPWFTDHRAQRHSRRLIALLGQATEALQRTDQRLRPPEIFILLAACYLHDIGMQDMVVNDKGWDELDVDDYEVIRKRHPERGKQLIVQGALSPERGGLRVDLDDLPEYLQPIALVSQGHGSSFYEDTVRELDQKVWAPDGQPIRGSLLTALLLMADELDVGSERASFPQGGHLSAVSALHHFLNHYVVLTSVHPGATSKRRQVRMAFEFPPDSDDYRPDVRRALVDKICAQARRTNPTVERSTDGELVWEDRVIVSEQTDTMDVRRQIDPKALAQLRRELRSADLVGREEIVQRIRRSLTSGEGVSTIALSAPQDSDLDAMTRWIAAEAAAGGGLYVELSFLPKVGRDAAAVLSEMAVGAGLESSGGPAAVVSADEVGEALASTGGRVRVFVFRAVEAADDEALRAIGEVVGAFRARGGQGVVVFSHDGTTVPAADHHFILDRLDGLALTRHLQKEFGYADAAATMVANELVAASGGRAGPIVSLLATRRLMSQANG